MNELFRENLAGKGYQYIANWLFSCRSLLYQGKRNYIDFLSAASDICGEWEQHYEANKSVYEDKDGNCTEVFQRALHYVTYIGRVDCGIDYGNGIYSVPLKKVSELSKFSAPNGFSIALQDEFRREFLSNYQTVLACFAAENRAEYKSTLDKLIRASFNDETWTVSVIQTGRNLTGCNLPNLLSQLKGDYKLWLKTYAKRKCGFVTGIESSGISKSTYNDFSGFNKAEKEFDKKLFVNLAFMLGLSYPLAEKLLHLNGYTFEGSERAFDKICAKGFKLGFGRDLTNALIEKRNLDLGDDMIPNLQKNSKALNISSLLAP